jgi:hypothetical protein
MGGGFPGFGVAAMAVSMAASAAAAPALPTIALEPQGEAWRVTYALAEPVRVLQFAREDAKGNRARTWVPVDARLELVLVDGHEVVRARDGSAFRGASFDVPPVYMPLDKDYAPFSPFGDGGLLIHSGRFHACPGDCAAFGDDPAWAFAVTPPAGSHVLQGGRVVAGVARFEDRGSGTNVYVGAATPVETAHVLAVIDAAFPPDLRAQLSVLFPRLMDLYAGELGALANKPMLFASNDEAHAGGGHGHQGGTLPGQVFMHLYGPRGGGTEQLADGMNWFFAHEAAHMYQRYGEAASHTHAWIHEGGAEAFAALGLQRLGLLDSAQLHERVRAAHGRCSNGLAARPLNDAAEAGAFDDYYSCGLLMHLAVDSAARRASDGACDLFCVWRDFLARIDEGTAAWDQDGFLAAVDRHAGADAAAFLRALALQRQEDPQSFLVEGLSAAGVALPPAP